MYFNNIVSDSDFVYGGPARNKVVGIIYYDENHQVVYRVVYEWDSSWVEIINVILVEGDMSVVPLLPKAGRLVG